MYPLHLSIHNFQFPALDFLENRYQVLLERSSQNYKLIYGLENNIAFHYSLLFIEKGKIINKIQSAILLVYDLGLQHLLVNSQFIRGHFITGSEVLPQARKKFSLQETGMTTHHLLGERKNMKNLPFLYAIGLFYDSSGRRIIFVS